MSVTSNWLVELNQHRQPQFRIFCFPYAGGGPSVFRNWKTLLPPQAGGFSLHYPGRESRFSEPFIQDFSTLVSYATQAIEPFAEEAFVLFGHSLGALLAFETARKLEQQGHIPKLLIVSGRQCPTTPSKRKPISHLPEQDFLQEMATYNGTPAQVLANQELMELLSPMIRADFYLAEHYKFQENGRLLSCPILALASRQDTWISPEAVASWSKFTKGGFDSKWFEGDHFYLNHQSEVLIQCIMENVGKITEKPKKT